MADIDSILLNINSIVSESDLMRINRYVAAQIKQVRALRAAQVARNLSPCDRVTWECGIPQGRGRRRLSATVTGTIKEVKRKYAIVHTDANVYWGKFSNTLVRVPLSVLSSTN